MTSRQRLIAALDKKMPDRLPVTTHHLQPYFLKKYLNGITSQDFFTRFGLDPIKWIVAYIPDETKGQYYDPDQKEVVPLDPRRICSDNWRIEIEKIARYEYPTERFNIVTPQKTLSMILQSNEQSAWLTEHLIKEKSDIDTIAKYVTAPKCDVELVNKTVEEYGDRGLVRGHICCFDGFGQPGCWQDAACLYGTENLIMATFDDPEWVHSFLKILQDRKKTYINSR